MDSIENLKYFLESILIVALNHTLTSDCDKSLPTQFEFINSVLLKECQMIKFTMIMIQNKRKTRKGR